MRLKYLVVQKVKKYSKYGVKEQRNQLEKAPIANETL